MRLTLHQVDAFTQQTLSRKSRRDCPARQWLPDETLQAIAAENNLAETAFYVKNRMATSCAGSLPAPKSICADTRRSHPRMSFSRSSPRIARNARVVSNSKSGELMVDRDGDLYALDFPSRPPVACARDRRL